VTELDANSGLPSPAADIGIAASGDAIVVWTRQESSGRMRIAARRYTSQGWSETETIDAVDAPSKSAYYARIAMNNAGEAVVAWVQGNNALPPELDAGSIWVRSYDPASGWGPATAITATNNTLPPMDFPAVTIADDGTRRVLWNRMQSDFTSTGVYSRRLRPGQVAWDILETLDVLATEKRELGLADDGAGNAVAWWKHYTSQPPDGNAVFDLEARRFAAPTGIWTATTVVASGVEEGVGSKASAAILGENDVLFGWDNSDPGGNASTIHTRRYLDGTPQAVTNHGEGMMPGLASGDGAAMLAGTRLQFDAGTQTYRFLAGARRYLAATDAWDGQWTDLDSAAEASGYPLVSANGAGQAMSIWSRIDVAGGVGAVQQIYAARFDGAAWTTAPQVLAGSANGDVPLRLSLDNSGYAIVLWQRGAALWANRFSLP
jgi:hypothetical protein